MTENTVSSRLEKLKTGWKELDCNIQFDVRSHGTGSSISIETIYLPKHLRKLGHGHAMVKQVTDLADEHSMAVTLEPSDVFGVSIPVLAAFYAQHGFVWRNRRVMIRHSV